MKRLSCLVVLCLPLLVSGQHGTFTSAHARQLALGGSGVALSGLSSLGNNPAGLAELTNWGTSLQAEQRFSLADLKLLSAGAALPTASGNLGLILHRFGSDLYQEQQIGFIYSRQLFPALLLGGQFNWFHLRIPAYGQRSLLSFDLGLIAPVSQQVSFGFHLLNPIRLEVIEGEFLATVLRLGLDYRPAPGLHLLAEVEKDIRQPVRIHTGLEYQIAAPLQLRMGIASEPVTVSFGIGLLIANELAIDVASSYHPILGVTPAIGVQYGGL